ncbi:hypothetical protein [Flavobacterium coralii]
MAMHTGQTHQGISSTFVTTLFILIIVDYKDGFSVVRKPVG